ncbi:Spy/CpxP family protein refolding chaperone [Perlabentimonas gracilis]|uniref:Spy/CpxP family protein refolding chaperone n=1 Tax=Perlabentimonas gracilis TaxID=2715279 RepID=UPI001409A92A|nr:periplasmic heavy metal sensor [Perlabentimonas gracilis]NHB67255.1 periplasmic heavy metal sensor [Perlabentimonas gracilis]
MNIFTKNRMLVGAVILLVALNIATIGTIALKQPKPQDSSAREGFSRQRPNLGRSISTELGLTPEQETVFEELRRSYFEENLEIRRAIQAHHRMIMQELDAENPNRVKLDSLAAEIGHLHEQQQLATIEHFVTLREVCSPEQYQNLQKIFRRAMPQNQRMLHRERRQPMEHRRSTTTNE